MPEMPRKEYKHAKEYKYVTVRSWPVAVLMVLGVIATVVTAEETCPPFRAIR